MTACLTCAKTPCYGLLGHFWGRLQYACRATRQGAPTTPAARLRLLWHDFILHALLHRGTERCQDCGRAYTLWHAEGDLWLRVLGSSSGLLCLRCFARRVEAQPWGRLGVAVTLACHGCGSGSIDCHCPTPVAAEVSRG